MYCLGMITSDILDIYKIPVVSRDLSIWQDSMDNYYYVCKNSYCPHNKEIYFQLTQWPTNLKLLFFILWLHIHTATDLTSLSISPPLYPAFSPHKSKVIIPRMCIFLKFEQNKIQLSEAKKS